MSVVRSFARSPLVSPHLIHCRLMPASYKHLLFPPHNTHLTTQTTPRPHFKPSTKKTQHPSLGWCLSVVRVLKQYKLVITSSTFLYKPRSTLFNSTASRKRLKPSYPIDFHILTSPTYEHQVSCTQLRCRNGDAAAILMPASSDAEKVEAPQPLAGLAYQALGDPNVLEILTAPDASLTARNACGRTSHLAAPPNFNPL